MFIDIHAHTTRGRSIVELNGRQYMTTPEELVTRYDQLGIEKAVLLPLVNPENTPGIYQSNEEILQITRDFPGRFVPFCNVDPRARNHWQAPLNKILDCYRQAGFLGLGEVSANLPFLDAKVQNLFAAAEENNFLLTFHISPFLNYSYGLVDDSGLPQLEESLRRFPKLRFLGHSQAFWAEISTIRTVDDRFGYPTGPVTEGAVPRLLRQYPNLYGDLSAGSGYNALARDREYAVKFLSEFQDRLLFGTDICAPGTPTPLVDFLLELRSSGEISEVVFQKIARSNAERLLAR